MLARSARLPTRGGYSYEPKLDGFRALLSTERGLVVYSRRRWNMTPLVPELEAFPVRGTFDGELIAFAEGQPDFVALTDRLPLGCGGIGYIFAMRRELRRGDVPDYVRGFAYRPHGLRFWNYDPPPTGREAK